MKQLPRMADMHAPVPFGTATGEANQPPRRSRFYSAATLAGLPVPARHITWSADLGTLNTL